MAKTYKILTEKKLVSRNSKKHIIIDATVLTPKREKVNWQYIESRSVVGIIALNDKKEVYLVKQWRPARNKYIWEIPAGGVEKENPTPNDVMNNANGELQEEIGFKAKNLEIVERFTPGVHINSNYYIVLATSLIKRMLPRDLYEELEVVAMPKDKAIKALTEEKFPPALNIITANLIKTRKLKF